MSRPVVEHRKLSPHRPVLEHMVQDAVDVVRSERAAERISTRVDAVLAVLNRETQAVQEGVYAGLKISLGKQYAKASKGRRAERKPSAHDLANSVFREAAA